MVSARAGDIKQERVRQQPEVCMSVFTSRGERESEDSERMIPSARAMWCVSRWCVCVCERKAELACECEEQQFQRVSTLCSHT